jgi:murein DD-endopeptidase MepM/ murein hydrolase activator NlpD
MKKFIAFFLLWSLSHLVAADQHYPFDVHSIKSANQHSLRVVNDGPATITTVIHISGANLKSDLQSHHVEVVAPYTSKEIGVIRGANPENGYEFNFTYRYDIGDAHKNPDPSLYRLPFYAGTKVRVGQSPGGRITTHSQPHSRYAMDFVVPNNTAVVAARAGVVIEVKSHFTEGGFRDDLLNKANLVTIQHADGTVASYLHLVRRKAVVTVGDQVTAGQLIGFSGNTGYSSGAHLHFGLNRLVVTSDFRLVNESVPVPFYGGALRQGMVVVAD